MFLTTFLLDFGWEDLLTLSAVLTASLFVVSASKQLSSFDVRYSIECWRDLVEFEYDYNRIILSCIKVMLTFGVHHQLP